MRLRRRVAVAVVVTAMLTALMWTDSPTRWWSSIINFFMESNSSVTSTVMDARPRGDLDLHLVLWATSSCVWWWALRRFSAVISALTLLAVWAMFVETLQPWFTEIRDRQFGDYVGNALGVGVVVLALLVRRRYADGPMSPET